MKRMSFALVLGCMSLLCSGVPVDVYAVAKQDGSCVSIERTGFNVLLSEVNSIYSQVALSFELRSYTVIGNDEMLRIDTNTEFINILDSCPSTNGLPVYVFQEIVGAESGLALEGEGCGIEASAGARVLAHELGHMCGLADIYASVNVSHDQPNAEELSVREEFAKEEWQPMDWGRYRKDVTQGELIDRMLMNGHNYVNADNGVDLTAGDVYGVRLGSSTVTNAATGEVSRRYEKGMAGVGFLLHGNRNPSRVVESEE